MKKHVRRSCSSHFFVCRHDQAGLLGAVLDVMSFLSDWRDAAERWCEAEDERRPGSADGC